MPRLLVGKITHEPIDPFHVTREKGLITREQEDRESGENAELGDRA